VCPKGSILISDGNMTGIPKLYGDCVGCTRCVVICPGLAITLVDTGYDQTGKNALVTVPWEMPEGTVWPDKIVQTMGFEGEDIGNGKIIAIRNSGWQDRRDLLVLEVPMADADKVAGIRLYDAKTPLPGESATTGENDDTIICRCERVTRGEIIRYIKDTGCTDFNSLKAGLRVGMGPCGGKTCTELVMRIFKQVLGRDAVITPHNERPFTQEVPLSAFIQGGGNDGQ
jgi:ferredoxin